FKTEEGEPYLANLTNPPTATPPPPHPPHPPTTNPNTHKHPRRTTPNKATRPRTPPAHPAAPTHRHQHRAPAPPPTPLQSRHLDHQLLHQIHHNCDHADATQMQTNRHSIGLHQGPFLARRL